MMSDGSIDANKKAFFVIGTFMAIWTIFYGFVQGVTPKILSQKLRVDFEPFIKSNYPINQ